jgi:putative peptide zinc metalloprotease protein
LAAGLVATALGTPPAGAPILAVAALLLVQVILHESAHALTCLALGTPIREFGIKLWCLVLPAPYVDRTDAYRLRRRTGRVVIALAGPFVDLVCAGVSGAVVLLADGPPAQLARALLALQLFVLATNLNPLLPSDGHQAIEAGLGELNIRHRATTYLTCRLLRRPLPAAYRSLTRGRRRLYLAYALLSLGYVALFLTFLTAVALTWLLR